MYLLLENNLLSLVDPMDRSVLHSQPITSIRVWGVGRDNGRLVMGTAVVFFTCTPLPGFLVHAECASVALVLLPIWDDGGCVTGSAAAPENPKK